MSGSFAIDLHAADTAVVRAAGELDVATAPSFAAALRRAVDSARPTVVIDLTNVSFADVSGLRPLFRTTADLRSRGRRCDTLGARPNVSRVIDLCAGDG